jgi:hypothetical protein
MSATTPRDPEAPAEPDIDDQGIDRGQIRDTLALEPEERLRRVEELLTGLFDLRARDESRTIR